MLAPLPFMLATLFFAAATLMFWGVCTAGRELAAAHGGPRDITDRGSAMSNAAKDNLGAGEAGNA